MRNLQVKRNALVNTNYSTKMIIVDKRKRIVRRAGSDLFHDMEIKRNNLSECEEPSTHSIREVACRRNGVRLM